MAILRTLLARSGICAVLTLAACSSGSGSTGAGGAGSGGGGGGGAGTGAGFAIAAHPALPQVVNPAPSGPVLAAPKVQPIIYSSDPGLADMEAFLTELTKTSFWSEATSEYGVGPLTVLPAVTITTAPPATITDADIQKSLAMNLSGATPPWGAVDTSTIYLFILPQGTIESDPSGACCTDFDGYHYRANVGGSTLAYAVGCACPGFDGKSITDVEQRTVALSHELVESSTDPFGTAFSQEDMNDVVWTMTSGGELADMCEFNTDSYYVPPGAKYMIQRSWSNAAAAKSHNPCVPAPAGPYFSAMPVLPDMVSFADTSYEISGMTQGVQIPVGQTRTIDVQLFSDAPTTGPWKVTAADYECSANPPPCTPNLLVSLDKDTGQNGDVLHLTITVMSADPAFGAEAFVLFSDLGTADNIAMGLVGN